MPCTDRCLMPQPPSGRDTAKFNPPLEPNPARHERRVDSGYASDGSDGSMPSLVDDDSGYASDDSYSVMPFVPARHHPLGTRGGTEARLASWVNGRRVAFGGVPSPQLACELAAWVEYEVRRLELNWPWVHGPQAWPGASRYGGSAP